DVRRGALMDAAEVAEADGGAASGARKRDGLCAGENIAGMRAGEFVARRAGAVSEGLGDEQQLQAGRDGELRDLTDAEGTCDIRRVCGVEDAVLKLQVADRRECGGSGDGGAARVGLRCLRSVRGRLG